MRTEEYKGRTLTIYSADDGDRADCKCDEPFHVSWKEGEENHGLAAKSDLPGLIARCKLEIDFMDDPEALRKYLRSRGLLGRKEVK